MKLSPRPALLFPKLYLCPLLLSQQTRRSRLHGSNSIVDICSAIGFNEPHLAFHRNHPIRTDTRICEEHASLSQLEKLEIKFLHDPYVNPSHQPTSLTAVLKEDTSKALRRLLEIHSETLEELDFIVPRSSEGDITADNSFKLIHTPLPQLIKMSIEIE
ncbi:hypothetical protein CPB83DRAFT_885111, partial [Crepidotus variabilis]